MRFDVEGWAETYLHITGRSHGKKGLELVCQCPYCGKDQKLYLNAEMGVWVCYACGEKGRLARLMSEAEDIPEREARKAIRGDERARLSKAVEDSRRTSEAVADLPPPPLELPEEFTAVRDAAGKWRFPKFLRSRGVSKATAAAYRLGFCLEGRYAGRLILPSYCFGELRTYQGRTMTDGHIKYLGPPGRTLTGAALFGLDQALGAAELVVCEGPFDVLALAEHGTPAVALMGKSCSVGQAALLAKAGVRRVIVMLDGEAFADAVLVARLLGESLHAHVSKLPDGVDPGEATADQIDAALAGARAPRLSDMYSVGMDPRR